MSSATPTPIAKSSKPQILLVPYDADSPEHVQRLVEQRIACGWEHESVPQCTAAHRTGELTLQWAVLDDSDPESAARLLKHVDTYPQEREPLIDSAVSFGGKLRTAPSPPKSFVPIGHIGLGRVPDKYESLGYAQNEDGLYWISKLYVSRALHGSGLGSATLDAVENLATAEPLRARILALSATSKIDSDSEKYAALNMPIPPFSNHEWYERRGYHVYKTIPELFSIVDSTGKTWFWDGVCMRKEI